MMKKILFLTLVLSVFLFSGLSVNAGDFSGIISFRKIDGNDTTLYKFYIGENRIRVEDVKDDGSLNGIMLINLDNTSILALSGSNKFYINVPISDKKPDPLELEVEKTKNKKKVAGMDCTLWIVKNKLSGEKSEYWVNKRSYSFFNGMLKLLNRDELIARSWNQMEVKPDFFPMIGIEYSPSGEMVTKIEVLTIEEKKLPESLFFVPEDYELLERQ